MEHPPPQAFGPTINRVSDLMAHTTRYAFKGVARLARDAGVSPSAVSRLINGKANPTFAMAARIAKAIGRELGRSVDPRELFAENGRFPTRYACDLARCRGCLPDSSSDEYGDVKRAFYGIEPGRWVTSRYPRGYEAAASEEGGDDADR